MSGYPALGDGVSDAMAAYAAPELGEPQDVEDDPRELAAWLQDVSYTVYRRAERLAETGIHDAIPDRLYEAGASFRLAADEIGDLTSFRLARWPG